MLFRQLDNLEDRLRPLLGLGRKPNHLSLFFGEPDEDGLMELHMPSEEVHDAEEERWHREPRRGRALSAVISALQRFEPLALVRRPGDALERRRGERELASARKLEWNPYHYCTNGQTDHIDAHLVLPSGRHYALDVSTAAFHAYWVREGWQSGGVYRTGQDTDQRDGVATAVVPTETLTPALVREAIERWYMDKYQYAQGHWSVLERKLPELVVDESGWSWPDDPYERELAEQAAARAEDTAGLLKAESEVDERTARRYGRSS